MNKKIKAKNPCAKTRSLVRPYEIWVRKDWTWRVLKKYQSPEKEAGNPYARWFCFVTSNVCMPGEYGDVYVKDIMEAGATLLQSNP